MTAQTAPAVGDEHPWDSAGIGIRAPLHADQRCGCGETECAYPDDRGSEVAAAEVLEAARLLADPPSEHHSNTLP